MHAKIRPKSIHQSFHSFIFIHFHILNFSNAFFQSRLKSIDDDDGYKSPRLKIIALAYSQNPCSASRELECEERDTRAQHARAAGGRRGGGAPLWRVELE